MIHEVVIREAPSRSRSRSTRSVVTRNSVKHDGRINYAVRGDHTISFSVSCFNREWLSMVEPKVRSMCVALKDAWFWPVSSCEGHDHTFDRYVTVVAVIEAPPWMWKFPLISIYPLDLTELANTQVKGNSVNVSRVPSRQEAIYSLNRLLGKAFNDYYAYRIVLRPANRHGRLTYLYDRFVLPIIQWIFIKFLSRS